MPSLIKRKSTLFQTRMCLVFWSEYLIFQRPCPMFVVCFSSTIHLSTSQLSLDVLHICCVFLNINFMCSKNYFSNHFCFFFVLQTVKVAGLRSSVMELSMSTDRFPFLYSWRIPSISNTFFSRSPYCQRILLRFFSSDLQSFFSSV